MGTHELYKLAETLAIFHQRVHDPGEGEGGIWALTITAAAPTTNARVSSDSVEGGTGEGGAPAHRIDGAQRRQGEGSGREPLDMWLQLLEVAKRLILRAPPPPTSRRTYSNRRSGSRNAVDQTLEELDRSVSTNVTSDSSLFDCERLIERTW